MAVSSRARRFVRRLLAAGSAQREGELMRVGAEGAGATLPVGEIEALASAGVLEATPEGCRSSPLTAGWLKRALLEEDAFAAQHRIEARGTAGERLNLAESPLQRLATAAGGESAPFLDRVQVEAGERVRTLFERAQLGPRLTMHYSAAHVAGGRAGAAGEIGDMAADARKALARLHSILPRDCADVVLDVCGALKGLQQIEAERGWPRRSAKLVLRIGLDRLAECWGMGAVAAGPERGAVRVWRE
jgi:hypothetical protein